MKARVQVKYWMGAILGAMLIHVAVASAPTIELPLGAPEGFSADAINSLGNDRYCISGHIYDDAGPSRSAMVVLVDAGSHRVEWRTAIPHGPSHVSNSAVACGSDGHSIYAVTEEHTQGSESLNQTSIVVNRLSVTGKLEKRQPIHAGFDEWFYMLDVGPAGVNVAGGTSATLQRGGPFGTFVAHLDADLGQPTLTQLSSGAFWTDTSARLDGRHLLLAGKFLPNVGAGHDGYAVSQIDLDSKRYLRSAYPLPGNVTSASALVSSDGGVYDVGVTPAGVLTVVTVDPAGKTTSSFSTGSGTLCSIDAVARGNRTVSVIGDACKGNRTVLLSVDLASHAVSILHTFGSEMDAIEFDGSSWVGVTKTKGRGAVFQRGVS
ncbi:hypothetical protein G3N96_28005 [Burkholderia sp. Se-20373]|uniref:hypothetical protein n=1 Tax=Burkholderia sp. Se-20373 TaxID=2703898 RepID=UPI0019818114|nr:hypothetical protein [Burkholderia sp. Se-20373]MBN3749243.1 hypothetical protein [Burkholderia sp. Se-20373]